jgi:predicted transcriptional regulator
MPDSIVQETMREVTPLSVDEHVGAAATKVIESGFPGLPVIDEDGKYAGIFGEREFMAALFPGYVAELASSAMIKRSIDETIERRESCREESIRRYLTTDHVLVEDDFSDTQVVELFLHHRVLIVPIATDGRVHALVTRNEVFKALAWRLGAAAARSAGS